jgi:multiple sugar transport system substrate-binding protein
MKGLKGLLVLLLLIVVVLPAWTGAQTETTASGEEIIEIEYVDLGSSLYSSGILDKMLDDFHAEYPNVKVTVLDWTYQDAQNKYLARIQAGNPPDCGYGFLSQVGVFNGMDALVPWGDYVSQDVLDSFFQANLDPVTIDGTVWAMPLWFSLRMLVYNNAWLEEAGLTAADLEDTDGFLAALQKMYNPPNRYGLAIAGSRFKNTVENFLEIFWPMGGELLEYDSSGEIVGVAFNNEVGVKAMEYYGKIGKMAQPGVLNEAQADAWRAFWSNNAFGTIDQPKVVGYILEEGLDIDWEVAVPPMGSNAEGRKAVLGVEDVGLLFKTTEARQKAAADFLAFIKRPEYSFAVNKDKNFIPCVKEVAENAYYQPGGEGEWLGKFIEGTPYTMFRPAIPEWAEIENALILAIQKVISGEATAKAAMDAAAAQVSHLFK